MLLFTSFVQNTCVTRSNTCYDIHIPIAISIRNLTKHVFRYDEDDDIHIMIIAIGYIFIYMMIYFDD